MKEELPPTYALAQRALPRWLAKWVLIVLTIALWLPTLAVVSTFATVVVTGCDVNEAAAQTCLVAGHDISEYLYGGLLMVFVAGPTLPFAIGCVVIWILARRRSATTR